MGSFTPPPTTALAPGDRLDRYELLCILAQGGMGTVWLSRMTGKLGFERLVALKTILSSYSSDRQFCDMFMDEAKIASQIDHENVARILEIGEDRGLLYYAMELIDGESLRKLYRDIKAANEPFPMGVALRIVADACAGLHATHELRGEDSLPLQVVHRDVSPQNLLVSIRGTTKLIDFGVAKAAARRTEETAAGTLKGKLEYMAPEQARGEPLDRRADVYSLGAVLYELLAGRPVRDTDEGKQLVALHELMTGAPYAPLPTSIPALVRLLVDRALSRDRAGRFASAEDLRRALEQAMLATGQGATTDDVAGVLAHYSRERTAKRKTAIERAVRAATDGRVNANTIVAPVTSVLPGPTGTQPGVGGAGSHGTGPGTPISMASRPASLPSMASMPSAIGSASGNGTGPPFVPVPSPPGVNDGPPTGPSMRTIGAAAMTAPAQRSSGSSAGKIFGGIVLLMLVGVLGVGAGVFVTRRQQSRTATPPPPALSAKTSASADDPAAAPASAAASALGSALALNADASAPGDPAGPATGVVAQEARDASAGTTTSSGRGGRDGGVKKGRGGKSGTKAGDGDEYGF